ncbi:MAPEG family protein [Microvirga sp. Mcv34]|uniref:MAPEG family protein n=1 Tax=Microvirga sp. Mcv34 TaxID=2926016 RepID=UPI0021C8F1C0|nr:MAPEG family protein [Microvirga sp. Mcv34]
MSFDQEQRSIVLQSALAVLLSAAVLGAGYLWLPPDGVGITLAMNVADRLAFALKWDLLMFLWLAGCVGGVAQGRFWNSVDRKGSAFAPPGPAIAVRAAVLHNSLEQTVLAVGAHQILATVLRGAELVLIPLLVLLYLVGRATFAAGYTASPIARAFGMALTGAPIAFAYVLAAGLILTGR